MQKRPPVVAARYAALPPLYLECGAAVVPYCEVNHAWPVPGGGFIADRRTAKKLCEQIDALMQGDTLCDVKVIPAVPAPLNGGA